VATSTGSPFIRQLAWFRNENGNLDRNATQYGDMRWADATFTRFFISPFTLAWLLVLCHMHRESEEYVTTSSRIVIDSIAATDYLELSRRVATLTAA